MPRPWVLPLALLVACDSVFFHPQVEEPCGVSVMTTAHRTSEGAQLRLATTCIEDAWNLGSFPTARLDGLAVTTTDGVALEIGPLAYTPDPEGGVFRFGVSPITADARYLQVAGRFVGQDAHGRDVATAEVGVQVVIEEEPRVR